MRAAFHLLVMICLLWCATGVAEPGQAHGGTGASHSATAGPILDQEAADHDVGDRDGAGDPGQAHHHHCPVAPDQPQSRVEAAWVAPRAPIFDGRTASLASLTRAPPLQPPSAA